MHTRVKSKKEIEAMREGGKMLATVLNSLKAQVSPGLTTKELANFAADELKSLGGEPSFLNYQGFPDVICISVNNEVVHGIPSPERVIKKGDIVSLDFGVTYRGMITDGAVSVIVGQAHEKAHKKLLQETEKSLYIGIRSVRNGVRTGDVGAAIQKVLDKGGYGIVRDLVGHGVGHSLHEDPNIPNYGRPHTGPWLEAGMTIAIEPMATLGGYQVGVANNGWTILTLDDSLSAHFEHTLLITENGAEILTKL